MPDGISSFMYLDCAPDGIGLLNLGISTYVLDVISLITLEICVRSYSRALCVLCLACLSGPASGSGILQSTSEERGWLLRKGLFGACETEETVPSPVDGMDPFLYFTVTHALTELLETSINRRVRILGPCPPKAGIMGSLVRALDALQTARRSAPQRQEKASHLTLRVWQFTHSALLAQSIFCG